MLADRPSLRALKDGTRDLHALAERYVHILGQDATVSDYVRYLRAMYGYHAPLDPQLAQLYPDQDRGKAHLLAIDLAALGEPGPHPVCDELPALASMPERLGAAYVTEGSTLGGRYILAKLPPALAPLRGQATAFLSGYGTATGTRWREFGEIVERELACSATVEAAVEGARDTFRKLVVWLSRHERRMAVAS